VSSLKCDKPSHPDWGRLGVVRAASVVQAPGFEGNALGHWLGLSAGGRLKARRKTTNGQPPPLMNEQTNDQYRYWR